MAIADERRRQVPLIKAILGLVPTAAGRVRIYDLS
jgi:hypothetical protein